LHPGIGVRDCAILATNTSDIFREIHVGFYRVSSNAASRGLAFPDAALSRSPRNALKIGRAASKQARISELLTDLREPWRTAFDLGYGETQC
jgi:hypothetical protein